MASIHSEAGTEFRTADALILAAWIGLASGLLEGVFYWFLLSCRWLSMGEAVLGVGPEHIWVAAAFNLVCFLGLALVLAGLTAWIRADWRGALLFGNFVFLGFFDLFALSGRLQLRGSTFLALGAAVQSARWYRSNPKRRLAWFRRTLPGIVGLAVLAYVGIQGGAWLWERVQVARLPGANISQPNVLLIVMDTLRADHLSAYGYSRPTSPNIDRIASEGVLFEHAYANSSWTLPSHASIFTGRLVSEHLADGRMSGRMLGRNFSTLAEALAARGYRTGGFTANTPWTPPWTGLARGFQHYECLYRTPTDIVARVFYGRFVRHYLNRWGLIRTDHPRRPSPEIHADFLRWLGDKPDRPFFAFLNLMDVHRPYYSEPPFQGKFQGAPAPEPGFDPKRDWKLREKGVEARNTLIGRYDNAISFMDAQVGALVAELKKRNLLDQTVVILTSDHGELFGEHGMFDHGGSVDYRLIHVPCIVRWPEKIPSNLRIAAPVSLQDLAATTLALTGVERQDGIGGSSLVSLWQGEPGDGAERSVVSEVDKADLEAHPPIWPTRKGWLKTVVTKKWQFVLRESGFVELYDLQTDPRQIHNLAEAPDSKSVVAELAKELAKVVPESQLAIRRMKPQPLSSGTSRPNSVRHPA